jgi:hypothetical protein
MFFLSGCETGADGHRQLSPEGRQALRVVGEVVLNAAVNAAASAASQYAETGEVDGGKLAGASISGAALGLRSLEATPQAANPRAIANTIAQSTGDAAMARTLGPVIANGVQTAIQSGVPASVAVEHAAVQLDTAAKESGKWKAESGKREKSGNRKAESGKISGAAAPSHSGGAQPLFGLAIDSGGAHSRTRMAQPLSALRFPLSALRNSQSAIL